MQGFNRYIPPDFDPKNHSTLNSHQGKKHALGKRAKDIDKGVLVAPFNFWCGSCGNHIGAGVRYNAQKRKVGNYYSTPIYAFRCKCHLCSGWFEFRTDPQNARYIIHEGAKKKDEEWEPTEHGGYATHDTEAPSASEPAVDPFAQTEKTIDQKQWAKKNTSRITELSLASARLSSDPYAVSSALRRRFREEKKVLLDKQDRDGDLRERYGLHEDVDLGEEEVGLSREMWEAGRERRGLAVEPEGEGSDAGGESVRAIAGTPGSARKGKGRASAGLGDGASPSLAQVLRRSTARKYDPFGDAADLLLGAGGLGTTSSASPGVGVKVRGKIKDPAIGAAVTGARAAKEKEEAAAGGNGIGIGIGLGGGLLAGYGSD